MARPRKGPWRRSQNGHWYTTVGRKNVKVADKGDSYGAAFRKYVELLNAPSVDSSKLTMFGLLEQYLAWVRSNRSPASYLWYQRYAHSFVEHVGKRLKVNDLRPHQVQSWIEARHQGSTDNTKHGLIRALLRPLNWGVKNGLVERNPIVGILSFRMAHF